MTVQCHSFDVFDTCLQRDLAVPSDLFLALAEDLEAQLEPRLGPDYRHIFLSSRKQAETEARRASAAEDVTLAEIWERLAAKLPGLDPQAGMAAELAAEAAALGPNRAVLDEVRALDAEGVRIVFISDSYLPAEAIRDALVSAGFPATHDNVHVSGEIGVTKARSGALFRHVLEREGVPAAHMTHLGDNWHADVTMARRAGIRAQHLTATRLTRIERALLAAAAPRDGLFVSRLVGTMRRFRLDGSGTGDEAAQDFTAAFSGPFLFLFACWLAGRARAGGIERLYFMSRDCYRLWRMAQTMPRLFEGIECRYLYASRQALYLPAVMRAQPEEMPWLIRPFERRHLDTILAKLELDRSHPALADLAAALGPEGELTSEQEAELMARLCRPPLSTQIAATAKARRDAALAYLEAEKLFEPERFAIVDLGWRLAVQSSLGKILRHSDPLLVTRGLYLGIAQDRHSPAETGPTEALFHVPSPDQGRQIGKPAVFGYTKLLEHILSGAPHGTVHHYAMDSAGTAEPVCADLAPQAQHQEEQLAQLAEAFAARLDATCAGAGPADPAPLIDRLVRKGLTDPNPDWIRVLGRIPVSTDQNNRGAIRLHQPYGWRDIAGRLAGNRRARPWPELSRAAAPAGLRLAMAAGQGLMTRLLDARALLRHARRSLRL